MNAIGKLLAISTLAISMLAAGCASSQIGSRSVTELRGRVMRLMDKGVVVDLGSDIEGFVPMSQLGIPDIQQPGDAVKEGQAVEYDAEPSQKGLKATRVVPK